MITIKEHSIEQRYDDELLVIEPWGKNSLRVRAFPDQQFSNGDRALLKQPEIESNLLTIIKEDDSASIQYGDIKAVIDHRQRLTFYNQDGKVLLKEFIRQRAVKHDDGSEDAGAVQATKDFNSTLKLKAREYQGNDGGDFKITTRFESDPSEKIFGMGQYQQPFLDLKNTILELAQRNSQISVPFYISNLGYGFLWNNPGIGRVTFAKNLTEWEMPSTKYIDYWISAGDTPKQLSEQYAKVTGTVPIFPKKLLGLWQSKLRYRTSQEVLDVVKKYHSKGIQLSVIAIDYFHWPKQGEYRFDTEYWPAPAALATELKDYDVEPIVSVWPTVQSDARNYQHYLENGYLVKVNRGVRMTMQIQGNTVFVDMTNKSARDYVWSLIKNNYAKNGFVRYWLDVAEPGYSAYDFVNYRYSKGTDLQVGNLYPIDYLKMVYEGNKNQVDSVVTLVRGAWAGAQRYGALAWSGDIDSSFEALRNQVNTGLNMGLAGIPWWTTDIGGFHGGHPEDPEFRELLMRWFEYATFSPVLRMHGDRQPHSKPLSLSGGGSMVTGAPNEIWSYGPKVEKVLTKFVKIRETLKDYLESLMVIAHEKGLPLMRPLFYEFPQDREAWSVDNTYMLGSALLIAPILNYQERSRGVYLPAGTDWENLSTGETLSGGQTLKIPAPIDAIPVLKRTDSDLDVEDLKKLLNEGTK